MDESKSALVEQIGTLETTLFLAEAALKKAEHEVLRAIGKLTGGTICGLLGILGAFIDEVTIPSIFIGLVGFVVYVVVDSKMRKLEQAVATHQQTVAMHRGQLAQSKAQLRLL